MELLPPQWLEITGCDGKFAEVVNGTYHSRKAISKKLSYQKLQDTEIPVTLWFSLERMCWMIGYYRNVKEASKPKNILAMIDDETEMPHLAHCNWRVVDHDASSVHECPSLEIKEVSPIRICIYGRAGTNEHRINGVFVLRDELLGGRYSFRQLSVDGEEIIMWYYKRKKLWMISWKGHVETENAYAVCKGDVDLPYKLDGKMWYVWNSDSEKFSPDADIRICSAEEMDVSKLDSTQRLYFPTIDIIRGYTSSPRNNLTSFTLTSQSVPVSPRNIFPAPPRGSLPSSPRGEAPVSIIPTFSEANRNWKDDANTTLFDLMNDLPDEGDAKNDVQKEQNEIKMQLLKPESTKNLSSLRRASLEIRMSAGLLPDLMKSEEAWDTEYLATPKSRDVPDAFVLDDSWD